MEYVNMMYQEKQTISDKEQFNTYTWTIEKTDMTQTSGKLKSTIIINPNADFSQLKGHSEEILHPDITEENADYVITITEGQKCTIIGNEHIKGAELYSTGCIETADDYSEIKAIKKGKANGYLYIGDEKKSIYIIVKEREANEIIEESKTITVKVDKQEITGSSSSSNNSTEKESNTIANLEKLPQTGKDETIILPLYILIGVCGLSLIILVYKSKMRKNS